MDRVGLVTGLEAFGALAVSPIAFAALRQSGRSSLSLMYSPDSILLTNFSGIGGVGDSAK